MMGVEGRGEMDTSGFKLWLAWPSDLLRSSRACSRRIRRLGQQGRIRLTRVSVEGVAMRGPG